MMKMTRRCGSNTSSPLAAVVLLLFLTMVCFFHCAAAARLLPAAVAPLVHQGTVRARSASTLGRPAA